MSSYAVVLFEVYDPGVRACNDAGSIYDVVSVFVIPEFICGTAIIVQFRVLGL